MDDFKILSAGISLSQGNVSKRIHFAKKASCPQVEVPAKVLNFFGEIPLKAKNIIVEPPHQETPPPSDAFVNCSNWFKSEEEIHNYRKRNRIIIHSKSLHRKDDASNPSPIAIVPAPIKEFDDLQVHYKVDSWIVDSIKKNFKFKTPTAIQQQAIPCILSGESLLASAPTGSGKTVAFLLPLIVLLKNPSDNELMRSLVVVPSRELAVQTVREFDVLRGKKNFKCRILERQKDVSKIKNIDLGVSTPLKLIQLMKENQIELTNCRHVVLDEADKLLDMGFSVQIDEILSHLNIKKTQFLFFSATLPDNVLRLVESVIAGITRISIGTPMAAANEIQQQLLFVTKEEGKLMTFRQLINDGNVKPPTLVFVQSIERAKQLHRELSSDQINVEAIHSERSKIERDHIIQRFREKKVWVLICTDLMARGVDFKGVRVVVNWDLPQSAQHYIHRIGRTGRAGREGTAITFFTIDDVKYLPVVIGVMKQSGCDIPQWMLDLKKPNRNGNLIQIRVI